MSVLTHPINSKWPAQNPEIIQLYSYPTPNGVKISIALEEMELDYEAHRVTLSDADVKSPEFLSLNPNNKIPAIIDPHGPDGDMIELFESGAILIYLAEKSGKFMGTNDRERFEVLKWLMFQMGGVGPMLGQLGYFYAYAGSKIEDPRPRERYINEAKRLLAVIDKQLADRDWIAGDLSIADFAIAPWLAGIGPGYNAHDVVEWDTYSNVHAYLDRFTSRSAVQKAINIPPR